MKEWKILSERDVFRADPFVRVVRQCVELPGGQRVDDFYQVKLRSYAITVPITRDGRIVMIEQYKHGPGRVGFSFPAGYIDPGEPPEVAAARELLEESGYAPGPRPGDLIAMGSHVDNGNQRGCRGHQFIALDCERVQAPDDGDLEDMTVVLKSPQQVDDLLGEGRLGTTHDVAAWGMARILHRDRFTQ